MVDAAFFFFLGARRSVIVFDRISPTASAVDVIITAKSLFLGFFGKLSSRLWLSQIHRPLTASRLSGGVQGMRFVPSRNGSLLHCFFSKPLRFLYNATSRKAIEVSLLFFHWRCLFDDNWLEFFVSVTLLRRY